MRKSTLAIAIAAAIAAPMAVQADTTLYGQAHMSLDYQDSDAGSGFDLLSNSSRIGVKGDHKISDGLSAVYKMEWQVSMDGETGSLNQRNRVAGLKGGFGTFLFGKHDTPFKTLGNAVAEDWGSTQMGGARQIRDFGGWDRRLNNVIAYISPNLGPVSAFVAYDPDVGGSSSPDEFIDGTDEVTAVSALLNVGNKKKFYGGLAYEQVDNGTDDTTGLRLGLVGNIGPIRLHGLYQQISDLGFVNGADRDTYGVGVSFKSGKNTFKGQYYTADDIDGTNETGGDLAMLGWDHALAKSTTVYLQYATVSNDDNSSFDLIGSGHGDSGNDGAVPTNAAGTASSDVDGFSAGLRVKF